MKATQKQTQNRNPSNPDNGPVKNTEPVQTKPTDADTDIKAIDGEDFGAAGSDQKQSSENQSQPKKGMSEEYKKVNEND